MPEVLRTDHWMEVRWVYLIQSTVVVQLQAASQRLGIFGLNALQLAAASVPLLDGA